MSDSIDRGPKDKLDEIVAFFNRDEPLTEEQILQLGDHLTEAFQKINDFGGGKEKISLRGQYKKFILTFYRNNHNLQRIWEDDLFMEAAIFEDLGIKYGYNDFLRTYTNFLFQYNLLKSRELLQTAKELSDEPGITSTVYLPLFRTILASMAEYDLSLEEIAGDIDISFIHNDEQARNAYEKMHAIIQGYDEGTTDNLFALMDFIDFDPRESCVLINGMKSSFKELYFAVLNELKLMPLGFIKPDIGNPDFCEVVDFVSERIKKALGKVWINCAGREIDVDEVVDLMRR